SKGCPYFKKASAKAFKTVLIPPFVSVECVQTIYIKGFIILKAWYENEQEYVNSWIKNNAFSLPEGHKKAG
ncbi:hypothetical protein CWC25_22525, partial [Pseudoalteromonas sp. S4389]|uniref:hypothetical protein n=1 Tax=Pseudoalteromonas sp. S4389 TaxID=579556 RepID=UPI0012892A6C